MSRRGNPLTEQAARALRAGPLHTLALARDVLSLSGPSGAVSKALFTLLRDDPRFRVDDRGVWRLAPEQEVRTDELPLDALSFAVVDVETTGSSLRGGHRIIEIAIVEIRNRALYGEYRTLINPGRAIHPYVQALTGISQPMVAEAPAFEHVADEIAGRLRDRVFVAHNVGFDWRFVSTELRGAGVEVPTTHRLCTVRLARGLLPRLRRRNLDAVTRHFGIPILERHRAYGDAHATARVMIRFLEIAQERGITSLEQLRRESRRSARRGARERKGGRRSGKGGAEKTVPRDSEQMALELDQRPSQEGDE